MTRAVVPFGMRRGRCCLKKAHPRKEQPLKRHAAPCVGSTGPPRRRLFRLVGPAEGRRADADRGSWLGRQAGAIAPPLADVTSDRQPAGCRSSVRPSVAPSTR